MIIITVFVISVRQFLNCLVNMNFGTLSSSLILMLYTNSLNTQIVMKLWYTIKYRTERAFHYTGMPVLEMRYFSQESIQRIFYTILFKLFNGDVVQTGKCTEKKLNLETWNLTRKI